MRNVIYYYKILLKSIQSNMFIFLKISISLRNHFIFSTSYSFPSSVFISPWTLYYFAFPPLGTLLEAMFDCQSLVSICCIWTFWLLIIFWYKMSMSQSSKTVTSIQMTLSLLKTIKEKKIQHYNTKKKNIMFKQI